MKENSLKVLLLGNGGCLNQGLHHNAMLINRHILVDCPPDVMYTLQHNKVDIASIDTIFLSHSHGDHTFGFPFFAIHRWVMSMQKQVSTRIRIIGFPGLQKYLLELLSAAFGKEHPLFEWSQKQMDFLEVTQEKVHEIGNLKLEPVLVSHLVPTFGFIIHGKTKPSMAFLTDTRWCDAVASTLKLRPHTAFIDMNGGGGNVHLSLAEIKQKALPLTNSETRFIGFHLDSEFPDEPPEILCGKAGETYIIPL